MPGLEAAGTVVAVGEGVDTPAPGQRVMAMGAADPGFYAELAAVPAARVTALPDGVDVRHAAGLPVAWLSAWYALHRLARVREGKTVVVQAAASGVGSAAVQIAARAGARVIAAARSAEKAGWAAGLGADETVDTSAFEGDAVVDEVLRLTGGQGADVVLDTVGGDTFGYSLRQAGFAGRVVALANVALRPSAIDTGTSTRRTSPSTASRSPVWSSRLRPAPRSAGARLERSQRCLPGAGGGDLPAGAGRGGARAAGAAEQPRQDRPHRSEPAAPAATPGAPPAAFYCPDPAPPAALV